MKLEISTPIVRWKVPGALRSPNDILIKWERPWWDGNAVLLLYASSILIFQCPILVFRFSERSQCRHISSSSLSLFFILITLFFICFLFSRTQTGALWKVLGEEAVARLTRGQQVPDQTSYFAETMRVDCSGFVERCNMRWPSHRGGNIVTV